MSNEKIRVPERGEEKYKILKSLYDKVFDKGQGVKKAFIAANEFLETPLSERGWFRAMEKWDRVSVPKEKKEKPAKPTDASSKKKRFEPGKERVPKTIVKKFRSLPDSLFRQTKETSNQIIWEVDPKKFISPEEKILIFNKVCEKYGTGATNLMDICQSEGVHHVTFYHWTDTDMQLKKQWEIAEKKNKLNFIRIFMEMYKQSKMREMMQPNEESWSVHYDYVPGINPETKMAEMQLVAKGATKHTKPRRLDHDTQKLFIQTLGDMYAMAQQAEMVVQSDLDSMSLQELDRMEAELLADMNRLGVKDQDSVAVEDSEVNNGE